MTVRRRGRPTRKQLASHLELSRLQRWLDENGFTSAELEAATGISRQQMTKIRWQDGDVRRTTMVRILNGACAIAKRRVLMEELFSIEADTWSE